MEIERLVKFFMPTKIKIILVILLFFVLPAIMISSAGLQIIWFLGGIIMFPLMDYIHPVNYLLLFIEAYVITCLIVQRFAPNEPSRKEAQKYYPYVRQRTN